MSWLPIKITIRQAPYDTFEVKYLWNGLVKNDEVNVNLM